MFRKQRNQRNGLEAWRLNAVLQFCHETNLISNQTFLGAASSVEDVIELYYPHFATAQTCILYARKNIPCLLIIPKGGPIEVYYAQMKEVPEKFPFQKDFIEIQNLLFQKEDAIFQRGGKNAIQSLQSLVLVASLRSEYDRETLINMPKFKQKSDQTWEIIRKRIQGCRNKNSKLDLNKLSRSALFAELSAAAANCIGKFKPITSIQYSKNLLGHKTLPDPTFIYKPKD